MNMKMRPTFAFFILFLLTGALHGQRSWDEIEYPELNSFTKPDVEIVTLENGIRFYLVEDHELPLISLRLLVRTGGFMVTEEKTGLSSITGTVMRTGGTTSIDGDSLNEPHEDRAASIETSIGVTSASGRMK